MMGEQAVLNTFASVAGNAERRSLCGEWSSSGAGWHFRQHDLHKRGQELWWSAAGGRGWGERRNWNDLSATKWHP